jgi:hypothetical protein
MLSTANAKCGRACRQNGSRAMQRAVKKTLVVKEPPQHGRPQCRAVGHEPARIGSLAARGPAGRRRRNGRRRHQLIVPRKARRQPAHPGRHLKNCSDDKNAKSAQYRETFHDDRKIFHRAPLRPDGPRETSGACQHKFNLKNLLSRILSDLLTLDCKDYNNFL